MLFYHQLKDLRRLKGYTIREVADRSGVSAAYISQLENGHRGVPSPDVLMKLSEGLNASYEALMQAAGYLEPSGGQSDESGRSAPVNLRRFLRDNDLVFDGISLSEEHKEWLERMLTAMFWLEKIKLEAKGERKPDDGSDEESFS
ncbi:helix-turn-helix domain-containing protein [Paenibacillus cymbidii]|uniref:helix-turn-helix domain-containing protein n=1 Tax=Paenibacillus cymbidii TaxID=1639034 RepID=UPI0010809953|nr:helix-turn-helix domain-containing protein [Paenibacillus cymbidii]